MVEDKLEVHKDETLAEATVQAHKVQGKGCGGTWCAHGVWRRGGGLRPTVVSHAAVFSVGLGLSTGLWLGGVVSLRRVEMSPALLKHMWTRGATCVVPATTYSSVGAHIVPPNSA